MHLRHITAVSEALEGRPIPPQPQPQATPGLLQKAVNFGKAIVDHVAAGMLVASDDLVQERLGICGTCDRFDAEHRACLACGCHIDIKVRWLEQRCPIGKW